MTHAHQVSTTSLAQTDSNQQADCCTWPQIPWPPYQWQQPSALAKCQLPTTPSSKTQTQTVCSHVSKRQSQQPHTGSQLGCSQALPPAAPYPHATTRWMMPFPNRARPMTSTKAAITFCSPFPLRGVVPGTDPPGSLSPTKCLPAVRPRPNRPGMTKACRAGDVCVEWVH